MAFTFITAIAISQQPTFITVKIVDAQTKQPIPNATISLNNRLFIADEHGILSCRNNIKTNYDVKVTSIGYENYYTKIPVPTTKEPIVLQLKAINLMLQPLEVKSIRAGNMAPFAKTNISKDEIAKINLAQDLPVLLNQTPSLYISSDAGNGVGYTYMHIRGSDATRINVTLNGIPYNDAESMGTYFVDLPDFTSSVNSIQIQRGVGTSSNGAGAFGATLNLLTNEFNEKAYTEINNSYGSFNTWKNTLKFGSGLLGGHFTIDGRISSITSDGYIDRAFSNLTSFAISTAYYAKKSSLRLNIFSGKEKTYQAWYGIDSATLITNRKYNPAGTEKPGSPYNNQTDNYWQNHYQLFFDHTINSNWSFNTALFLTYGRGYYEEYKANQAFTDYGMPFIGNDTTDLVRQRWLKNYFWGQIFSFQYKKKNNELMIGGGWNNYDGSHFGNVIWTSVAPINKPNYYTYPAIKTDANIYAKWQYQISPKWQSFVDIQYRHVYHRMDGFEGNGTLSVARKFNFINPKAGITYHYKGLQVYFSYAEGNKEPNRDDFQASLLNQPIAETLHDFELGLEKKSTKYNFSANVYYMLYKNQLVLTGQINDVGAYTRTNIPNSYRLGVELQGEYIFTKWLTANANLAVSRNKIESFTEYIDNWDNGGQTSVKHTNTDISFSPNVIAGGTVTFIPTKNFEFSCISKYVSKIYLDNTQNANRSLNAFFTEDVKAVYTIKHTLFKEWTIIGQLNNIFNTLYQPNGWTYPYYSGGVLNIQNGYYPMAGTNFVVAINIKL